MLSKVLIYSNNELVATGVTDSKIEIDKIETSKWERDGYSIKAIFRIKKNKTLFKKVSKYTYRTNKRK